MSIDISEASTTFRNRAEQCGITDPSEIMSLTRTFQGHIESVVVHRSPRQVQAGLKDDIDGIITRHIRAKRQQEVEHLVRHREDEMNREASAKGAMYDPLASARNAGKQHLAWTARQTMNGPITLPPWESPKKETQTVDLNGPTDLLFKKDPEPESDDE